MTLKFCAVNVLGERDQKLKLNRVRTQLVLILANCSSEGPHHVRQQRKQSHFGEIRNLETRRD